jgi:GNAT superfamily N-acetyltransferase
VYRFPRAHIDDYGRSAPRFVYAGWEALHDGVEAVGHVFLSHFEPGAWAPRWSVYHGVPLVLSHLHVVPAHRGRGVAQKLLRRALAFADKECTPLLLEVRSYGRGKRPTDAELRDFYCAHDFRQDTGFPMHMYRLPR